LSSWTKPPIISPHEGTERPAQQAIRLLPSTTFIVTPTSCSAVLKNFHQILHTFLGRQARVAVVAVVGDLFKLFRVTQ